MCHVWAKILFLARIFRGKSNVFKILSSCPASSVGGFLRKILWFYSKFNALIILEFWTSNTKTCQIFIRICFVFPNECINMDQRMGSKPKILSRILIFAFSTIFFLIINPPNSFLAVSYKNQNTIMNTFEHISVFVFNKTNSDPALCIFLSVPKSKLNFHISGRFLNRNAKKQ